MPRLSFKHMALIGALVASPATAAERRVITLASGTSPDAYRDESGALRDPTIACTHYTHYPHGQPLGRLVTEDAYVISRLGSPWATIPGASWISWYPSERSPGTSHDLSHPYFASYDVTFELPERFADASVEIQYGAEDWMNAYMNGSAFVDQLGMAMDYFEGLGWTPELCASGCISTTTVADPARFLVPGSNTLTLRQWDPDGTGGIAFLVRVSFVDPAAEGPSTLEPPATAAAALPAVALGPAAGRRPSPGSSSPR